MLSKFNAVRQELLSLLREGHWQPGEQLPALPVLAARLGASR